MRPLYLEGYRPLNIALEEGPALAITKKGEATRLLPLSLLSHIIAKGGNIQWSQSVLLTCAELDIPIYFSDPDDHLIAAFRANSDSPSQDWHRFMRLIEDPDGIDFYRQFLAGKESHIQQDVTQRWTRLPETRLPGYHRCARIIRSAIQADVGAELHRRGFRRRIAQLRQAGIRLDADFSRLLEPCVHWVINENWIRERAGRPLQQQQPLPPRRVLLHGYEQRAEFIRDIIKALVISFLYWLAESDTDYITQRRR